jgi:hypothetical protein
MGISHDVWPIIISYMETYLYWSVFTFATQILLFAITNMNADAI